MKFNFPRDVAPVASFVRVPNVMAVGKVFEAKTVAEFIAYARANPGKVNMASGGQLRNWQPSHAHSRALGAELHINTTI
jgi:tripartite-type tricarboxylate transporter receptor subunit TctC